MTTFDDILSSYVDYTNLADAAAGAALLRDCAGFKLTQNETFTDGPGDRYITVFGSVLETILKLDTAITVASYYETNEELGNALSLATFSGDAVGLARTESSGKYMRKIHTIFWYEMTQKGYEMILIYSTSLRSSCTRTSCRRRSLRPTT